MLIDRSFYKPLLLNLLQRPHKTLKHGKYSKLSDRQMNNSPTFIEIFDKFDSNLTTTKPKTTKAMTE